MRKTALTSIGVIAVLVPFAAAAQNTPTDTLKKVNKIKEQIITGQYGENTLKQSVYRVRLIDQKRIQQQGAVSLGDIMANELNVRVNNDATLGSGMNIQGMTGQNVKILIDGVPVIGREGGSINLNQINLANIERIEMVEGPMSVNYGTDALGGVVNLITKKNAEKQTEVSASSYTESSGKYNFGMSAAFKYNKDIIQLNAGRNFFNGFNPKDSGRFMTWKPYLQYFGDLNATKVYARGSLRMQNGFFFEKVTDRDSGTITPYYAFAIDRYYYTTRLTSSLFWHHQVSDKLVADAVASFNYYRRVNNTYSKDLVSLEQVLVPGTEDQDTTWFYAFMSRGTLSANKFNKWLSWQTGYEYNTEANKGKRISGNSQVMTDYNLFGSAEIKALPRLTLRPGLRLIYNTRFDAPLAPSVNLKWDITGNIALRASYGRGFRAPSLKEMYLVYVDPNHNVFGNTGLRAEVSDNIQVATGFEWQQSDHVFRFEPSVYYNHLTNKISLLQYNQGIVGSTVYYKYANIDDYQSTGTNLTSEYRTPNYSFVAGYSISGINTYLRGYAQTDKYYFSQEARFNLTYTFVKKQLSISLFCKFNGKQQLPQIDGKTQSLITGYIDGYRLMDLTVSKQLYNNRINLSGGCKNMMNIQNVSANISTGVHSDISSSAMIGMGRLFFLGANILLYNK